MADTRDAASQAMPPPEGGWVRFDDFALHLQRGELRRRGEPVRLQPQATKLLVLLVSRAGDLVLRHEIQEHLWGSTVVDFEQGVHNAMRQIRAALGDSADSPRFVQTVPRRGYRFAAHLERALLPTAAEAVSVLPAPRRRLATVVMGSAIAATAALALGWPLKPAVGPEPTAAYHKARHLLDQHRPDDAERALPLFETAIRETPSLAQAYSGLAAAVLLAPQPLRRLDRAREALDRAVALAPDLAEARAKRGEIAFYFDWDPATARAELDLAVRAAPQDALVLLARAHVLAALGRHTDAIAEGERALALDPVAGTVRSDLGMLYFWARRYAEAADAWRAALELRPDDVVAKSGLLASTFAMGHPERALPQALESMRRLGASPDELALVAAAAPADVERTYLRFRLQRLEADASSGTAVAPEAMAYLHARLGQTDAALDWLERAFEQRSPALMFLGVDPDVDALRAMPRFHDLLARIGRASRSPKPEA